MNDEYLFAIEGTELSPKTITTYTANYRRLMRILKDEPILCFSEERLVRRLKEETDVKPMSMNGMVSVILLIRRSVHLATGKIEKYKELLSKDHYDNKAFNSDELVEQLATIKQLWDYTNQALEDEDFITYIINYLMIKFGVRNMDLDLDIIKDKSIMKDDTTTNYIYITKKYAMYVVQSYKTRSVYGVKKLKIEDKEFMGVCEKLLVDNDTDQHTLFTSSNNNKFIQSKTLNGMGEGLYFKSIIYEMSQEGYVSLIKKIGATRGTSLSCVFDNYYVEAK